jgi:DNA helicase-2/ATP-dependent DNA helicase PcrA
MRYLLDPLQTLRNRGLCPRCGKPVTVGVLNRAAQLADRDTAEERPHRDPFHSLIPLKELLAEILGAGTGSKLVCRRYAECLNRLGPELPILLSRDRGEIERAVGAPLASAIERTRKRMVLTEPGYDGEYGRIRTWPEGQSDAFSGDRTAGQLFQGSERADLNRADGEEGKVLPLVDFDVAAFREMRRSMGQGSPGSPSREEEGGNQGILEEGTPEQEAAAGFMGADSLILAGPGTGKTRTLVSKIVKLLEAGVRPERILAVTFTNKAAREIGQRVSAVGEREGCPSSGGVRIRTFHGFGLSVLEPRLALVGRSDRFMIADDQDKHLLLKDAGIDREERRRAIIALATRVKNMVVPMPAEGSEESGLFRMYQDLLAKEDLFDYDDLVYLPVTLFQSSDEIREEVRGTIDWLLIDEFQDINPAQYRLVTLLSGIGAPDPLKICAIGDPNQSIYRFRGASPAFIERFMADFPDVRVFTLSLSYRCPRIILDASAQVIGRGGEALAGLREGVRISVMKVPTEAAEAEQIARDIEKRTGGISFFSFDSGITSGDGGTSPEVQPGGNPSVSLSDIAVLCRTGMQIPRLQKALRDHRIPLSPSGPNPFSAENPFALLPVLPEPVPLRTGGRASPHSP